jgi:hypothetical protein
LLPLKVLTNRVVVGEFGAEWCALGASTSGDEARLEGFHAPGGLLLVLDETKAITQAAFDAVQGALTGEEAKMLVTSVPGGAGSGPLWKACEHAGDRWRVHHLSSEDSSLVRPEWVEDMAKQWGTDSPLYQMRVRGEFADQGEGVLFPVSLLESVTRADVAGDGDVVLGVDVARSVAGDKNCIAICRGGRLQRLILWRSRTAASGTDERRGFPLNFRPSPIPADAEPAHSR